MCGVFAARGASHKQATAGWLALQHRGPDARDLREDGDVFLGHTRLSIIDVDHRSDQPMQRGGVTISFNGEVWNYAELRAELLDQGALFYTEGDTEVLAHVLAARGVDGLHDVQGMFGVAWLDRDRTLWVARDRFGEVPMHVHMAQPFMAASEVKSLLAAGASPGRIAWLPPGGVVSVTAAGEVSMRRWYDPPSAPVPRTMAAAAYAVGELVEAGARERAIADVPACTLLSGGIDSAAVALALKDHVHDLVAYVAVMDPKSPDLRAARAVAEWVGIELREVQVVAPTTDDLAAVVSAIEMPHKAQVEIGWACLALARRMREDGRKVTFSGEGSDELWASYGFAYHGLKKFDWHEYRKRLFLEQHRKNFARCNKVFMAHGVECRLPFLSTPLVEYALSLPRDAVAAKGRPKAIIQEAFDGRLPAAVIKRQKLAFQDGLGLKRAIADARGDARALYLRAFATAFPGVDS